VDAAEFGAHAAGGGAHLFEVAHVGADAESGAPGVLDFQLGQIQFRLAASQEAYARALGRESYGQPLADAAAGAGDEYTFIFERIHAP